MKKELSEQDVVGMTVNERLYFAGLNDDFEKAVAQDDETKLKDVLGKSHLKTNDIQRIIGQYLKREDQ